MQVMPLWLKIVNEQNCQNIELENSTSAVVGKQVMTMQNDFEPLELCAPLSGKTNVSAIKTSVWLGPFNCHHVLASEIHGPHISMAHGSGYFGSVEDQIGQNIIFWS